MDTQQFKTKTNAFATFLRYDEVEFQPYQN